jgi:hypothetical protein
LHLLYDCRPIGLTNSIRKVLEKSAIQTALPDLISYFEEANNFGLSPNSGAVIHSAIDAHLAQHPDHIVVATDTSNAHNEFERAAAIDGFTTNPNRPIQKLSRFMAMTLACEPPLFVNGKRLFDAIGSPRPAGRGDSSQGGQQGASVTGVGFIMTLHPHLKTCNDFLKTKGGFAIAGHDDIYLVGPAQDVWDALEALQANIATVNLTGQLKKFCVFSPSGLHGNKPHEVRIGSALDLHKNACELDRNEQARLTAMKGIKVYGTPLGSAEYIDAALGRLTAKIKLDSEKVINTIYPLSKQASWVCFYYGLQHKFEYFLQILAPTFTLPHAETLDTHFHRMAELSLGFDFRDLLSIARLHLPIRLRGLGIRRQTDIAGPSYIGMMNKVFSRFLDRKDQEHNIIRGLFPHLEPLIGAGSFDHDGLRFTHILEEDGVIASHLKSAWNHMRSISTFGLLENTSPARVNASQSKLQEIIDNANVQAVETLLPLMLGRSRRAWFQLDGWSSVFLHCIPNRSLSLASDIFREIAANYLLQPSPALSDVVDEQIHLRNRSIICDAFGDNLTSCALSGNGHKICHDAINSSCFNIVREAGLHAELEPTYLWSQAIPNVRREEYFAYQNGSREERKRGFVPDFLAHSLAHETHTTVRPLLYETKSITYCPTWYSSDNRLSAVEKRASLIQADYNTKARKLDAKFNSTPAGIDGPVFRSLSSYGQIRTLVFGRFSETSVDVSRLVKMCATIKARSLVSNFGGSPADMTQMRTHFSRIYKRKLALTSLASKARLLLDRKVYVGLPYRMHDAAKGRSGSTIPTAQGFGENAWNGTRGGHFYDTYRSSGN